MRIAVTGTTGFIGRHLVAELERRSLAGTLLYRSSSEPPSGFAGHTVVPVDLKNIPSDAFDRFGRPDVLIHLAWDGLPNYKSLHHFEEELPSQYRFLKSLVDAGLRNLLVTGTCFEYGMQSGLLDEGADTRPNTPYGLAKNTLRCQLEYLQGVKPFNLNWVRLFYLYGEGQAESSLLSQLRRGVHRGDRVFDMSRGEQLRDYLPIGDAVKDIVSLALASENNGLVNVCSGQPTSVRSLVERWIKENGWSIDLNLGHYSYPDYEPLAFWGDRTKRDRCLGRD